MIEFALTAFGAGIGAAAVFFLFRYIKKSALEEEAKKQLDREIKKHNKVTEAYREKVKENHRRNQSPIDPKNPWAGM